MTTIGSINPSNLEKKELKAPENEVKNQPLFEPLQTNTTPDPSGEPQIQGPLKAYKLNYGTFKERDKIDAQAYAQLALEAAKTLVDDYNNDFPQNQYTIEYNEFPKPEDFAQFRPKDAFVAWKSAVDNWGDDIRSELSNKKEKNLQNLNNTMASGFTAIASLLKFSTEFVAQKLGELGGDVNKLNQALKQTQNAVIKNSDSNAEEIMNTIVATYIAEMNYETNIANGLHDHIDDSTQELEGDIKDVKNTVIRQSSIEQANVVRTAKHIEDTVRLTAEQTQELNALSGSIDVGLQSHSYRDQKKEMVLNKRNEILNDENLTFEDKKNKLTTLSNIVTQGDKVNEEILKGI